jgi:hypothetical protein
MTQTLRTLRREPAFVLVALLTLGFGIGANTAIFSIIKGVDPLPYEESDDRRVVEVSFEGSLSACRFPPSSTGKLNRGRSTRSRRIGRSILRSPALVIR